MSNRKQLKIKYFDVYGLRKEKYKFLESHDVENTKWQELELKEPYHFFVPKDFKLEKEYQRFLSLSDIFEKTSSGIKTHRDHFVAGFNESEIRARLRVFISDLDDEMVSQSLDLKDTRDWKLKEARIFLKEKGIDDESFFSYLWRPFDFRKIYYSQILIELPRLKTVGQIIKGSNLALCISRKIDKPIWDDVLTTNLLADVHCASGQTYVFPLYLYGKYPLKGVLPGQKRLMSIGQTELDEQEGNRKSNIKSEVIKNSSDIYKKKIAPEEIFYYVYGILYSNTYRKKYQEFLKIDFPKIPFTSDYKLFKKVANFGKELVDLHLLKSSKLQKLVVKFPITGDRRIKKRDYNEKEKRIYINEKQYFDGVESEIWNYYIGGYQVLDKWLKDRTGKVLSREDVNHFLKVISALKYTIDLQKEIDKIYPQVEKKLIEF